MNISHITLLVIVAGMAGITHGQQIVVSPQKSGGIYTQGETITWTVHVKGENAASMKQLHYILRKDCQTTVRTGDLVLKDNAATLEAKLDEPGTLMATISGTAPTIKTITALAGAVVAPEKIAPSSTPPNDFDAFWKAKLAELAAISVNSILQPAPSDREGVDYFQVTMDNIRGTHIHGQLARPSKPGKRPALLLLQYAGVYPLHKNWVTDRAAEGWLVLDLNAHDLPIDRPKEYYDGLKELADYASIGIGDRETSYFLRMYLSCYRAVEYLASRDDWDGKTLAVMGSSQGGLQTLMVAGLNPRVTAAMVNVPAGCDNTGPLVGRDGGWPKWYSRGRATTKSTTEVDLQKVIDVGKYYDVVNFARHIKCPTLVTVGLIDTTCPADGILAAYNQIQAQKQLVVMEQADHLGQNYSQKAWHEQSARWLQALLDGKPVP